MKKFAHVTGAVAIPVLAIWGGIGLVGIVLMTAAYVVLVSQI